MANPLDIVYYCLALQPPLGRNESSSEIIRQVFQYF
jgi:hypothetical protein